jgi:hypothetical protein
VDPAWSCGGPAVDLAWTRTAGRGIYRPRPGCQAARFPLSGVCRGPSLIPPLTCPDAAPGPSQVHRRTIPGPPQVHPGSMPSQAPGSRQKKSLPAPDDPGSRRFTGLPRAGKCGCRNERRGRLPGTGSPSCGWVPPLTARPPRRAGRRQRAARRGRPGRSPEAAVRCHRGPSWPDATAAVQRHRGTGDPGACSPGPRRPGRGHGHGRRRCTVQGSGASPACTPLTSRGGPDRRHGEAVPAARASLRLAITGSGSPGRAGGRCRTRCRPGPGSPAHRRGTDARPASGAGAI